MNYYPFHIGDFRSGTANMSRLQRAIYRELIDIYYDTETPLPLDMEQLHDAIGAESEDDRRIIERLLRFKFIKQDDGYHHEICDKVIADYHAKAEIAKANGKLGGRPTKAKLKLTKPSGLSVGAGSEPDRNPDETGSQANQEPITSNQEPKKELPHTPQAGQPQKISGAIALSTYLDRCKAEGAKPIPECDSVFEYAAKAGISTEFLRLQWLEFKERYSVPGAKRYKAWATVFGKSVRGNWFKLWYALADGGYALTTVGLQAQRNHREAA